MKYVNISRPDGPCWGVIKGENVFTLSKPPFEGIDYDGRKSAAKSMQTAGPLCANQDCLRWEELC